MKGGGSRLNVNTDKPHSLISIKNKVLPTSPPARQSPQAPPTAARSWRPGEREPGSRWWRRAAFPGRAPPLPPTPVRPPPPAALGSGLRAPDTSRHAPGTPSRASPARADPAPHTLLRAHAAQASRQPHWPGDSTEARGDRCFLALLARRECRRRSGAHASGRQVGSTRPQRGVRPRTTDPLGSSTSREGLLNLAACDGARAGLGLRGQYLSCLPSPGHRELVALR